MIERGGEVIPKVVRVYAKGSRRQEFALPRRCPACGPHGQRVEFSLCRAMTLLGRREVPRAMPRAQRQRRTNLEVLQS